MFRKKEVRDKNVNKFDLICDIDQINRIIVNLLQNSEDAFDKN